jgi:hypothetical protein
VTPPGEARRFVLYKKKEGRKDRRKESRNKSKQIQKDNNKAEEMEKRNKLLQRASLKSVF